MSSQKNADKQEKSMLRHLDDRMLVGASTKLGLTDYDPNKVYDQEEKKVGLKEVGIIVAAVVGFIAVATILVVFVLT